MIDEQGLNADQEALLFQEAFKATVTGDSTGLIKASREVQNELKVDPAAQAAATTASTPETKTKEPETPAPPTPPPPAPPVNQEEPKTDEGKTPPATTEPSQGNQPPVQQEAPDPKEGDSTPEWFKQLPENVQKEVARIAADRDALLRDYTQVNHQFRSNAGRINSYQKQVEELKERIKSLEAGKQPAKENDFAKSDIYKKLKEMDPEFADALAKRDEELTASFNRRYEELAGRVTPLADKVSDTFIAQQGQLVRQIIPNISEILNTREWQHFAATANPKIKELINSPMASDGIDAVKLFHQWATVNYPHLTQEPQAPTQTQIPQPPPKTSAAVTELLEDRKRRQEIVNVPANNAPVTTKPEELDAEALFLKGFESVLPRKR